MLDHSISIDFVKIIQSPPEVPLKKKISEMKYISKYSIKKNNSRKKKNILTPFLHKNSLPGLLR